MKKYRVKLKRSDYIFGEFNSRKEASKKLIEYVNKLNEGLEYNYITIFDFDLDEVEKEVNEAITDFETARKAIDLKPNDDFTVVKKKHSENIMQIEDVAWLVNELNPKHIEALIALNQLFTIAEAWNKEDGFIPDFSDWHQEKWFPWFKYDKDAAWFVCVDMCSTPTSAAAYVGSRLCFKTSEIGRAHV